jgi:cysteinyl-tRNA synthetase
MPVSYKVRYWDQDWRPILFQYADRVLASGFDGVYLDIVDAYEYFADRGRVTAAQDMADLVAAIASYFRARDPGFFIFSQNAPELASRTIGYLDTIYGIGQEDIYFGYEADGEATDPAVTLEIEGHLDYIRDAGKLVLTIDYAVEPGQVRGAYGRARDKGSVPFSMVRSLARLIINPGYEPD